MKKTIVGLQGGIPISCILHIGAGHGNDLSDYLQSGARRIVLVEPEKDCASVLKELSEQHDEVEFLPCAVAAESGRQAFNRFGFSDLNGLLPPATLLELYPGLETLPAGEVEVQGVADLIDGLGLDVLLGPNLLVIEAPGQAQRILAALAGADLLNRFRFVRLRDCRERLYREASTLAEAAELLRAEGFETSDEKQGGDPDWPVVEAAASPGVYTVVPAAQHLRELQAAKEEAEQLAGQLQALNEQLESVQKEKESARAQVLRLEQRAETAENALDESRETIEDLQKIEKAAAAALGMAEGQIELLKDMLLPRDSEKHEVIVRD